MAFDTGRRIDLEKAARDSGFETLVYDQEHAGARLSGPDTALTVEARDAAGAYALKFSDAAVTRALAAEPGFACEGEAFVAGDAGGLRALLLRAWQVSRALPLSPLKRFQAALERALAEGEAAELRTQAEALVKVRIGQDCFRAALMDWWGGRCAVTGLAQGEMLRASHVKPWADCASDAERLDVFNGLLLAADWDAAFDAGLASFTDAGEALFSGSLGAEARARLGAAAIRADRPLAPEHRPYLAWHREAVFRGRGPARR